MKKIFFPLLLLVSCSKQLLQQPSTRVPGDVNMHIETLRNCPGAILMISVYTDGSPILALADTGQSCGQFNIYRYHDIMLWDVAVNDIYIKPMGWIYKGGTAAWSITLTHDSTMLARYHFIMEAGQLEVEEWRGEKYYRTYKRKL